MGNLSSPASVQKLQTALQTKAKESSSFRFYELYDKMCRADVLAHAYAERICACSIVENPCELKEVAWLSGGSNIERVLFTLLCCAMFANRRASWAAERLLSRRNCYVKAACWRKPRQRKPRKARA